MRLSNRSQNVPASPMRELTAYAEEAEKRGIKIYYLNIGQPDIETPSIFYETIEKNKPKVLGYSTSAGRDDLRNAMLQYYESIGISLEFENINVTTGGSEGIELAMALVCDPEDEIIMFEPFYANYLSIARMLEINPVPVTTSIDTGYHLPDKEEIEAKITSRTRAIFICNPNNPTGTVFSKEEIEILGEIAKEHDLFLIADEVYREFVYDGLKPTSVMSLQDLEDRVILIDSLSKRFSICGARVGCVVSRSDMVMEALLRLEQTRLSSPTLEQIGSIGALGLPQSYHDQVAIEYEERRDIVYEALQKIEGVTCKKPQGAFYIFAQFPIKDAEEFAKWMLTSFNQDNKTVLIAPGHGFYCTPNVGLDEIRIAYVLKSEDLKDAMSVLEAGLKRFVSEGMPSSTAYLSSTSLGA